MNFPLEVISQASEHKGEGAEKYEQYTFKVHCVPWLKSS